MLNLSEVRVRPHRKIIKKCQSISKKENIKVRQTYIRTIKQLCLDQRFGNHPKNKKRAIKADRKMRTIASRLVRELERNLGDDEFMVCICCNGGWFSLIFLKPRELVRL